MEIISVGLWIAGLFGKSPTSKTAKRIGWTVIGLGLVIALALLIWLGVKMHDRGVVEVYQDKRDADVARATVEADRQADAALENRAAAAEAENERLENAMAEAKAADPDKGTRAVGKVQQSYFDNLPARKH